MKLLVILVPLLLSGCVVVKFEERLTCRDGLVWTEIDKGYFVQRDVTGDVVKCETKI